VEARALASLTISFGLVAIPVKLYSAILSAEKISFNMLHKADGSRLRQQYICAKEGTVVEREEIVKGYEFAKDQFVIFTPAEIQALQEAGSAAIHIVEFVELASVDPLYFDRTYYLAPDKGGGKPYTLLVTALRESKQCAVGRWASHGREYIVILRPIENGLAMQQLHFAAEVRPIKSLGIETAEVRDAELKLARQIIDQQGGVRFDPLAYVDEVKARIEAAIEKKIQGQEISRAELEDAPPGNIVDLMAALKASLDKHGASIANELAARKSPKRAAKTAKTSRKASRV